MIEYYYKMLREYTDTARKINTIRWQLLKKYISLKVVLDYGCGVGWFKAFAPKEVEVDNFDIMKVPQTGITRNYYDLVCLWDVLEHFDSIKELESILKLSPVIALTIPIVKQSTNLGNWKHFKPREHKLYFSRESLILLFKNYGYELIYEGTPECPPREDILTAIFRRKE